MSPEEREREDLLELVDNHDWEQLASALQGKHPADIARLVTQVPSDDRERVFSLVEEDAKPDVLAELEGHAEDEVLEALTNDEISDLVEDMAPDDAADVLADLSKKRSEEVLDLMEEEESEEVRELLKYGEETAGGLMTSEVPAFRDHLTVGEVIEQFAVSDQDEPVYNIYVVNEANVLIRVIELWELLRIRDRSSRLGGIGDDEVISATTDMDQEEVAHIMSKYDLAALPVVDADGRLVGRITIDDVVDVMEDEASEDIFRLAGSDDAELNYTSPMLAVRARLPWLLVTLGFTLISSLILKRFMLNMSEVLALSFFVPIVMAMCGSTGMQSSTLIIRSLALRTLEGVSVVTLLAREIVAGILMGIVCGVLMGLWAQWVISHSPEAHTSYPPIFLAVAAGGALITAMIFAAVFGALVPIMLNKLRIDPAVASGPFVTASNDVFALLIYYAVTVGLIAFYPHFSGRWP